MRRGNPTNRILDFYVGIPFLNTSSLFRRQGKLPSSIERIGLMFNHALGDTLLASGPVCDLRKAFADQQLICFAARSNVAAAKLLPCIDHCEVISLTKPFESILRMREFQLDLMLDFTAWQRLTAFLTMCSGARYKVGFRTAGQYRGRAYDHAVLHRSQCHELENLRGLLNSIGIPTGSEARLTIPDGEVPTIARGADGVIVFHPWPSGQRSHLREWSAAKWVELALNLKSTGRLFVVTGSPLDEPRCIELCSQLSRRGVQCSPFIGRNGLVELANLLKAASLLVSVNTGIMHLSSLLETPTVSINGPNAQARWGPIGGRSVGVDTPDGTGGFLNLGYEFRGNPTDSMDKISVQQVLAAVRQVWQPEMIMVRERIHR